VRREALRRYDTTGCCCCYCCLFVFERDTHIETQRLFPFVSLLFPFPSIFLFLGSLTSFSKGNLFCGGSGNSFFEFSMRGFWASRRVGTSLLFERGLRKFGRISAFSFSSRIAMALFRRTGKRGWRLKSILFVARWYANGVDWRGVHLCGLGDRVHVRGYLHVPYRLAQHYISSHLLSSSCRYSRLLFDTNVVPIW